MMCLSGGPVHELVLLGSHCDDIAIGLGGTLLALTEGDVRSRSPLRVHALVFSGAGTVREQEEHSALEALCPGAELDLTVLDIPDGHAPAHWGRAKDAVAELSARTHPDVVFAPQPGDAHQDHRLLAEIVPTEFRDHLVLGYEILKWEADTPRPAVYHPITATQAKSKARVLLESYPSQRERDWFDESSFLALTRLRGVQCRSPHAEAFTAEKAAIAFSPTATD